MHLPQEFFELFCSQLDQGPLADPLQAFRLVVDFDEEVGDFEFQAQRWLFVARKGRCFLRCRLREGGSTTRKLLVARCRGLPRLLEGV